MKKGIYLALTTAVISGFSIFASKIFVAKLDPIVFTTLKNLFVAVILTFVILNRRHLQSISKLNRQDILRLTLIGIIGGGIPFALFFTGLTMTSAATGAIIHKTLFIWVAILAYFFLKEKLKSVQIIGYILIMASAIFIAKITKFTLGAGELMILGATILWAIENVIAKRTLKNVSSELVAWARMTVGSIVVFSVVIFQGKSIVITGLSQEQIISVLIGGILLTAYVLTWYKALSYAPASLVAVILTLSTLITSSLSAMFITHNFPVTDFASNALLIVGITLIIYLSIQDKIAKKVTSYKL